jgi:hypothetical protein
LKFSLEPVIYPVPDLKHLGTLFNFGSDATTGANNIVANINQTDTTCGNTVSYVLAGYSLGAWAVHKALGDLASTGLLGEISGVVLFGDPKFVPFQNIVRAYKAIDVNFGMATTVDVADNRVPGSVVPQTGSWCFATDPVCQVLPNAVLWENELAACLTGVKAVCAHFQYVNKETGKAAQFLDPFLPTASLWPHLTSPPPPDGTVGDPYTWTATAAPQSSLTWTWNGTLPPGLSFDTSGVLSGTPTQVGTFTFTVTATAAYWRYASGPVTVTVKPVADGGTWTPSEAPMPADAASDPSASPGPVACASALACVLTYQYTTAANTEQWALVTGSGTSWTATEAPLPAAAPPSSWNWIYAAACASATACVAVGDYLDASGLQHGWLITGSGTSWTATDVPLPQDAGTGQGADLYSVACASTCVAVGDYIDSSGYFQGLILTGSGTSWTATEAPLPVNGNPSSSPTLGSVACPSVTTCVAVGDYTDSSGTPQGLILTGSGTSWTATEAPVRANGPIACASISVCVATGYYNGQYNGRLLTGSGTSWTATEAPPPPGGSGSSVTSVACAPASECAGIGSYSSPSGRGGLLVTGSGTSWTGTAAPLPANAGTDPQIIEEGVACPSATACVAVGSYLGSSGITYGLLLTGWENSWTATEAPLPTNAWVYMDAQVSFVTCVSTSACVATGWYNDSAGQGQGLILNGSLSG